MQRLTGWSVWNARIRQSLSSAFLSSRPVAWWYFSMADCLAFCASSQLHVEQAGGMGAGVRLLHVRLLVRGGCS